MSKNQPNHPKTSDIDPGASAAAAGQPGTPEPPVRGAEALPPIGGPAVDAPNPGPPARGVEALTPVGMPAGGVRKAGGVSSSDLDALPVGGDLEAIRANLNAGHYADRQADLVKDLAALSYDDPAACAARDQLCARISGGADKPQQ